MTDELDKKLCRDYPLLFSARNASMMETCMCWGFECGDGWEPLIRRGAEELEKIIASLPNKLDYYRPRASQVKEKYGTLRFYMSSETDEMEDIISTMEEESETTCEECGAPGKLASTGGPCGWYKTSCAAHLGERYEHVKEEEEENEDAI